jgi:V8-like Glu-specific endopeptidase
MTARHAHARVTHAELLDAKHTVARFLRSVSPDNRFEALSQAQHGRVLSEDAVDRLAAALAQACRADPAPYRTLGVDGDERRLRRDLGRALRKVAGGDTAALAQAEYASLEAITLLVGRPALLVKDDSFQLPDGVWQLLAPHRGIVQAMLRAVARVEVPISFGGGTGTAVVVGDGLVMTNRHVLDNLYHAHTRDADGRATAWRFLDGLELELDFKREFDSAQRSIYRVAEIVCVLDEPEPGSSEPDVDLALLRLAPPSPGHTWPAPVRVQRNPASVRTGARVCVAGYPDADWRNDQAEMDRIFASTYQVKRLAPGEITGIDPTIMELTHDCSTLGGNSGSCVFDLDTNSVVGLHWGGHYRQMNRAVFLPGLLNSRYAHHVGGVNFQEN